MLIQANTWKSNESPFWLAERQEEMPEKVISQTQQDSEEIPTTMRLSSIVHQREGSTSFSFSLV